jgi:DNA-binding CsgD family transcriptional regulator
VHVSLSALESALRFVDDLADTDDPADLGRRALPGLDRLIHADVLTYNEFGPAPCQVSYSAHPEDVVFSADSLAAFAAHAHEHPLIDHLATTGDGSPMMISDFLSQESFHRLGLYAEFYRDVPVEHQIAIGLPKTDGRVIGIALNRARGDFTEDDRDLLAVLRAPLVRAMIRARSRDQARQALSGPADSRMADLTDRELQLLELVALGNTNTAIARKLGISPRTVAHHLDSAYRKLDVTSRAAAVYRAVNEGLVPPKPPGPANPPTPRSKLSLGREALEHPATDDASYGHPGAVRDPLNLLDLLRGQPDRVHDRLGSPLADRSLRQRLIPRPLRRLNLVRDEPFEFFPVSRPG